MRGGDRTRDEATSRDGTDETLGSATSSRCGLLQLAPARSRHDTIASECRQRGQPLWAQATRALYCNALLQRVESGGMSARRRGMARSMPTSRAASSCDCPAIAMLSSARARPADRLAAQRSTAPRVVWSKCRSLVALVCAGDVSPPFASPRRLLHALLLAPACLQLPLLLTAVLTDRAAFASSRPSPPWASVPSPFRHERAIREPFLFTRSNTYDAT